jgi:hypothetical protein
MVGPAGSGQGVGRWSQNVSPTSESGLRRHWRPALGFLCSAVPENPTLPLGKLD